MSVGKTSLLQRLVHGSFRPASQASIGVAYFTYSANTPRCTVSMDVWDTAGQERFQSVNRLYYRRTAAAVLVYDIGSRKSFESLDDWLDALTAANPGGLILAIAGNKSDLPATSRAVPEEEGRAYAAERGAHFLETSAKTGSGVRELFDLIARAAPEQLDLDDAGTGGKATQQGSGFVVTRVERHAGGMGDKAGDGPVVLDAPDDGDEDADGRGCCGR